MKHIALVACLVASFAQAQTHSISGVVLDRAGRPIGAQLIYTNLLAAGCPHENTVFSTTGPNGTIRIDAPPSLYALRVNVHSPGEEPIYLRVDTRAAPVSNLVVRHGTRAPFGTTRPPIASRITVSAPDANMIATVRGAPGAVAASGFVVVVTQETGHYATAIAAADGSFETAIYAPPGTWLIVKHDEVGLAWSRMRAGPTGPCQDSAMAGALAGTIVPGPPATSASGIPFATAAALTPLPLYEFRGSLDRAAWQPGETIPIRGTLVVKAQSVETTSPLQTRAYLSLENVHAAGQLGARAANQFTTNILTPTGLAIETGGFGMLAGPPTLVPLVRTAVGRAEGTVEAMLTLPADLAPGYYRPLVAFEATIPATPGEHDVNQVSNERRISRAALPIIRVGAPSAARLPVALLMDHLSNASLGVRAIEDRERFAIASRIATQSDVFVIPRVDGVTGEKLRYRLEPFLPSVSIGDRGESPETMSVPLRFPSGMLRVVITAPDGTTRTLGPAPIAQALLAPLVDRDGKTFDAGGGHPSEPLQLTTLDPRFEVEFERNGVHRVRVELTVDDIRGTTWSADGTFDITVAAPLTLDTTLLPGTPLETGNAIALGGTLIPPMPADIEAKVILLPQSDSARAKRWTLTGRANEFGSFRLDPLRFDDPGEYRIDITATSGTHAGARTWGGVVAPPNSPVVAHGMRAIDDIRFDQPRPQWFFRAQLPSSKGGSHIPFPFHSGDVTWQERGDSAVPVLTFHDVAGAVESAIGPRLDFTSGETILPSLALPDGRSAHLDPSRVDLWMYTYTSVQRPLVRVREEIFDTIPEGGYWRFGENYGAQPGVGRVGDATNDFKFQFGGLVFRGPAFPAPLYAIYGSLFVLIPDADPVTAPTATSRTFPPFQGNPGGASGGPLFRLKGQDVDLFLHPTGVRPGTILERGETATFAGYVAPTLAARVEIAITSPGGSTSTIAGRANRIGWFYDPAQDFVVSESGRWRAKVTVVFDGATSSGQVQQPFPTGGVPGSRDGEFFFYVVDRGAPALEVASPVRFIAGMNSTAVFTLTPPGGLRDVELHTTVTMPGFVLEETTTSSLSYALNPQTFVADFPNLDADSNGMPADVIALSFLVSGTGADGVRTHFARQVTVVRGEVIVSGARPSRRRAVR